MHLQYNILVCLSCVTNVDFFQSTLRYFLFFVEIFWILYYKYFVAGIFWKLQFLIQFQLLVYFLHYEPSCFDLFMFVLHLTKNFYFKTVISRHVTVLLQVVA